jgi:hypothetical protein
MADKLRVYDFAGGYLNHLGGTAERNTPLGYVMHESAKRGWVVSADEALSGFLDENPNHGLIRGIFEDDVVYEKIVDERLPLDVFRSKLAIVHAGKIVCKKLNMQYQPRMYPIGMGGTVYPPKHERLDRLGVMFAFRGYE